MDHLPAAGAEADVGDAIGVAVGMEKEQITGLEGIGDWCADGELQPGIPWNGIAGQAMDELAESRAIDAEGGGSAPEIGDTGQPPCIFDHLPSRRRGGERK